jgi:hypothetical protein
VYCFAPLELAYLGSVSIDCLTIGGRRFLACGKGEGNLGKIPFLSGGCLASSKLLVVVVVGFFCGFLIFLFSAV